MQRSKKQKMEGGYTYTKNHTILYKWNINNLSRRLEPTQVNNVISVWSSEFTTGSQMNDKWRLVVEFNNGPTRQHFVDNLTVYLENLQRYEVSANFSLFILNDKQEKRFVSHLTSKFKPNEEMCGKHLLKKRDLLANKSELMPNDTLTVGVEVTVSDNKITVPIEASIDSSKIPLIEDLKNLYTSKMNSDITIIIEGRQFEADKIILMARSPVLAAMFTHDMTEKKSNEVSITDIAPEIFEKLLQYIYTDEVTDLDVVAADLLEAADKYQLQSLKKMCEVSICKNLNCDNAIDMMILADRHNATNLLEYVTKCIALDGENIIKTDGFKKVEKSSIGFLLFKSAIALNANNGAKID